MENPIIQNNSTFYNSYVLKIIRQTLSSSGTVSNPYGFQGGYKDASTGLYKYGERYYNPTYVTWTQLDPSGQNAGYLFAGDDPVNQEDPSGTLSFSEIGGAFLGGCAEGLASTAAFALESSLVGGGEFGAADLGLGCVASGTAEVAKEADLPGAYVATKSLDYFYDAQAFLEF